MWQLMRRFTLDMLKALSSDGRAISDKSVVDWANAQVTTCVWFFFFVILLNCPLSNDYFLDSFR